MECRCSPILIYEYTAWIDGRRVSGVAYLRCHVAFPSCSRRSRRYSIPVWFPRALRASRPFGQNRQSSFFRVVLIFSPPQQGRGSLGLDGCGEFVELRGVVYADLEAGVIASGFNRTFHRFDCLLKFFDLFNRNSTLSFKRAVGKRVVCFGSHLTANGGHTRTHVFHNSMSCQRNP